MTQILIGLTGAHQARVAEILSTEHRFTRMSFDGPIRDMLVVGFGVRRTDFNDPEKLSAPIPWLGVTAEGLLHALKHFWAPAVMPDLWIKLLERRLEPIQRTKALGERIVVTDVDDTTKAEWLRARGRIWHLFDAGSFWDGIADEADDDLLVEIDPARRSLEETVEAALKRTSEAAA